MQLSALILLAATLTGPAMGLATGAKAPAQDMTKRDTFENFGRMLFERNLLAKRSCDCAELSKCGDMCAAGFSQNPAGQGACVATCADSAGCGQNTVCCNCNDGTMQENTSGQNSCEPACADHGGVNAG